MYVTKKRLSDPSYGGIIAIWMSCLARADLGIDGMTITTPDGSKRWISRDDADRYVYGPTLWDTVQ